MFGLKVLHHAARQEVTYLMGKALSPTPMLWHQATMPVPTESHLTAFVVSLLLHRPLLTCITFASTVKRRTF